MDAGGAFEDFDLEAGVVRKAVAACMVIDIFRLHQGVGPEGFARFGDILFQPDLGGSHQFKALAKYFLGLAEFAAVARRKYNLHFIHCLLKTNI